MSNRSEVKSLYAGKHLSLMEHDGWEFASRKIPSPAVGIVAITDDDRVVLVEQYRLPVGCSVIECPAGLSGDTPEAENESLLDAAKRELREETGYQATRWTELGRYYSSPGLTDEVLVLYLAEGLIKVGEAGGDGTESIVVYEVPRADVFEWLKERNVAADMKLLAGLYAAERYRGRGR